MTSLQTFRIFPKLLGAAVPGGEPEVPACDFSLLEQQQPLPAAWGHFVCFFSGTVTATRPSCPSAL